MSCQRHSIEIWKKNVLRIQALKKMFILTEIIRRFESGFADIKLVFSMTKQIAKTNSIIVKNTVHRDVRDGEM